MTNPLVPVMDWYEIVRDGMRVTARVIRKEIPGAIVEKHVFHYEPPAESLRRLADADRELDDLVVLSLVAIFERALRDYLMGRTTIRLGGGDAIDEAVRAEVLNQIEYWRISDRLIGVFRSRVDGKVLGMVKQIIGYRNWVAHGRASAGPPGGNVAPQIAFETLTAFLDKAGLLAA